MWKCEENSFGGGWGLGGRVLKEGGPLSEVHLLGSTNGNISEKVVLVVPSRGIPSHGCMKGTVSEKVVLKKEWSLTHMEL